MSLIKKSDVKNHLSPRYRTKIHLCPPVSQPDATGYSVAEPDAIRQIHRVLLRISLRNIRHLA